MEVYMASLIIRFRFRILHLTSIHSSLLCFTFFQWHSALDTSVIKATGYHEVIPNWFHHNRGKQSERNFRHSNVCKPNCLQGQSRFAGSRRAAYTKVSIARTMCLVQFGNRGPKYLKKNMSRSSSSSSSSSSSYSSPGPSKSIAMDALKPPPNTSTAPLARQLSNNSCNYFLHTFHFIMCFPWCRKIAIKNIQNSIIPTKIWEVNHGNCRHGN